MITKQTDKYIYVKKKSYIFTIVTMVCSAIMLIIYMFLLCKCKGLI